MQIKYELKFLDYFLFNLGHHFFSPAYQGAQVLFAAVITWTVINPVDVAGYVVIILAMSVFLSSYLLLWIFQLAFTFVIIFGKNKTLLTAHTVEVLDDALFVETKFNKTFSDWSGVVKVVSRFGGVAIYITTWSAYVIPDRAFASPSQKAEFLKLMREKVQAASKQ